MSLNCCAGKSRTITESLIMNKRQNAKVVFLGKSGVGKTSIIHRYTQDEYLESSEVTMGGSFTHVRVKLDNGEFVTLDIWDTAGQERYKSLLSHYYRGAVAAVIVYDVNDHSSFEQLDYWVSVLRQLEPRCTVFLVGNKCEVKNVQEIESKISKYATRYQLQWLLTSAKENRNINLLFDEIAKVVNSMPIMDSIKSLL